MFNFYNNNFKNQNSLKENEKPNEQTNNLSCENSISEENTVNVNSRVNANAVNFEELQKARQDLIGEIQAIIEYDNHIKTASDKFAQQTWTNIKHEEMVHVGELLALIDYLDNSQRQYVEKGLSEFAERLRKG